MSTKSSGRSSGQDLVKSTGREYFESLVITVILALFGTTFIVQAFKIPTPSMENNLLVGDHLLVNKFAFATPGSLADPILPVRGIERGNVIVFRYPLDRSMHYVKRVVGVPGDHVRIVNKDVVLNGETLDEPYKIHTSPPGTYADPLRDYFPPRPHPGTRITGGVEDPYWYEEFVEGDDIVVPDGYYFVMGDNRDNSADSRYWGFVPREDIVGKALVIYWSYETESADYLDASPGARVQQFMDLGLNFFRKTRWDRMFQIIR
jgi:signal peptidase I